MQIGTLSCQCLQLLHIPATLSQPSFCDFIPFTTSTMDTSQYWPFTREYSIWNAAVSVLQFWTEDLKTPVLSHAIDWVYTDFFRSDHAQQIWNLPEEILSGHFLTTLNDTSEIELAQEDEGYESGSENFYIPTPISWAPRVYYINTVDDFSFNPVYFVKSPTPLDQNAELLPHRQMLQPHIPPPGVHQLRWWEPCQIQWTMQPTFQCQGQRSNHQGRWCFIFSMPWLVSPMSHPHGPILNWSMGWC